MLTTSRRSSSCVGRGMIKNRTMTTTARDITLSMILLKRRSPPVPQIPFRPGPSRKTGWPYPLDKAANLFYQFVLLVQPEDVNQHLRHRLVQAWGNELVYLSLGVQGPGQACNLRDNGFNVIVGQRPGKTYEKAVADGWVPGETLFGIEEACQKGTIIMCLLSDAAVMSVWPTIKPYLTPGKALYFSHGFAITWNDRTGVVPPKDIDVIMVAPKGSGTSLRTMFLEGRGLNSSYAVYQDATGKAFDKTIALGIGIGSGYLFETTFIREATSDLTGERGSLMGAIQGLLLAQYEVLRENGHTPSEAFNETVEELTQSLMPLFAKNGMDWMYANCSTTAQRGALDWMTPFHDAIKPVVQKLYASVKSGNEAQISIDSNSKPDYREKLNAELKALRESEMWQTAVTVRKLRPENN